MIGFGQGWVKNFVSSNPDFPHVINVQQTNDLGYVIFNALGLIKTNSSGDTLWTRQGYFDVEDGLQTLDGGYILIAYDTLSGANTLFKLDNTGLIQWKEDVKELTAHSIEQTSDSGYVLTGTADNMFKADEHICIVRTNPLGDTLWTCQPFPLCFPDHQEGSGRDIDQTNDGNYIVAGSYYRLNTSIPNTHALLTKINNSGDTIWTKKYLFDDITSAYSVVENTLGNFVFAGYKKDSIPLTWSSDWCKELLIVETDPQGNVIWVKTYQTGFCGASANSIEVTSDGGYIVCGERELQNGEDQIWVLKTNNQGDTLWTRSFGDPYGEGVAAKQTADGGYIITGYGYQNSFSYSIMLIKLDGNGNVTSIFNIPTSSSNRRLEKIVDILGRETKSKMNEPLLYIYDDGTVEKRIIFE
jgi:hypothetical protein